MPPLSVPLAAIRQPAFLYDAGGRIAEANDPAEALAGRPLAGRSASDLVEIFDLRSPDGTPFRAADLPATRALAGEETVEDAQLAVRSADGRTTHVLSSASPLRDENGLAGALAIWQDVSALVGARAEEARLRTESETAAEELRVQEEELRLQSDELREQGEALRRNGLSLAAANDDLDRQHRLLDSVLGTIPYRVSLWDRDGRLVWANRLFAGDCGWALDVLIGRRWGEVGLPPDATAPLAEGAREARAAGRPVSRDLELPSPDGPAWRAVTFLPFGGDALLVLSGDITGRKRTEEAEARLRALMDHNPSLVFLKDEAGLYVYLNETYERQFVHMKDWRGKTDFDFWPRESADLFRANDREVLESGRTHQFLEDSTDLDGTRYVWLTSKFPFTDARGERYVGGIGIDATAFVRAEEALRETAAQLAVTEAVADERQRLFAVLEALPAAICLLTPDYGIAFANRRFRETIGASVGRPCYEACFGLSEPCPFCESFRVLETGEPHRWEVALPNGRIIEANDLPFTDVDGSPMVLELDLDITEERRMETALREANARLEERVRERTVELEDANARLQAGIAERTRAEEVLRETRDYLDSLIDYANAPIIVWDPAFRITRFNAAFEHLSGHAADEVIGRDLVMLFPEESREESLEKIQRTITERWQSVEIPILRPDGEVRIALWNSANIDDTAGTLLATIAQGQDITERKQAEEALQEYAENLRRSNEDLERFAYVSSHDLQEPLRSIVSFSQLLERRYKGQLGTDADEYIEFIVEGGTRMQTLIQDLLAFSRVNTTRQQIARTDAEDVFAEAVRTLDVSLREAEATLTHDPMPVVVADPTQLAQVFSNLISNAVKFRRPDVPLQIHVGVRRTDGSCEFSVSDNGIGIDPEYFEKIFVIFQRLHTKETYPGTGIGLAIVKRIIDRHGGTIRVESMPGEGSTFVFTLPAA
jgi:PAS domain S-box-containing protein